MSELRTEELSRRAQDIIERYTARAARLAKHVAVAGLLPHAPPWGAVSLPDYEALAEESEYAAWTLLNGFALNHTTVAVHRLGAAGLSSIYDVTAVLKTQARLRARARARHTRPV